MALSVSVLSVGPSTFSDGAKGEAIEEISEHLGNRSCLLRWKVSGAECLGEISGMVLNMLYLNYPSDKQVWKSNRS